MERIEYKNIGEVLHIATLPNGLKLRVVEKPGFGSYYAVFAADYGGAHRSFMLDGERKDTPAGVAHFLEHKMFELPNGDNALEMLTANGADPNAFTSSGMTAYYFQCTEKFEDNLRLLLHFVSTPYFTDETVAKEQGIIAQEIHMGEDNPGVIIYYNLLEMLYESHPIRDRVAGSVESIAQINAETLYDCHRAFYSPGNMCLCVEGDVDAERILQIAMEELGDTESSVPCPVFDCDENELPVKKLKKEFMPVSAPQFFIGAKLIPAADGEGRLRQRIVAQLALRMLVGLASPFYARLYAQGLLNRDFDYEVDFAGNTATIIIGGESQQPERVLEELNTEVERVRREGFDCRAFELAKRASLGARLRGLEDFDNVCISLVEGVFEGFCALDSVRILNSIEIEECRAFVCEKLAEDRLAVSIIEPGRG